MSDIQRMPLFRELNMNNGYNGSYFRFRQTYPTYKVVT